MRTPTEEAYTELQHAYDFFNMHLFDGLLPPCMMTIAPHSSPCKGKEAMVTLAPV